MILTSHQRAAAEAGQDVDAPVSRGSIRRGLWKGGILYYRIDRALSESANTIINFSMFSCLLSSHFAIMQKLESTTNSLPSRIYTSKDLLPSLWLLTLTPIFKFRVISIWIYIVKRFKIKLCRFYCDQVVTAEQWTLFEREWRCGVTIPASHSERQGMNGVTPTFKTVEGEWRAQVNLAINQWSPITTSYFLLRTWHSPHFI